MTRTVFLSSAAILLLAASSATAQAPAPRDTTGFVLPGPPPVNAPAPETQEPAQPAEAPDQETKAENNWPCVQRRVDVISPAAVWRGPSLEMAKDIERTPEMQAMVERLSSRRIPVEEAGKIAADYLESLDPAVREAQATAIFADVLTRLNFERTQVMEGIERYAAKQKALAEQLREQGADLNGLSSAKPTELNQAQQAYLWNMRIFDERRASLTYVCEVPTLIDQRLFALGRSMGSVL